MRGVVGLRRCPRDNADIVIKFVGLRSGATEEALLDALSPVERTPSKSTTLLGSALEMEDRIALASLTWLVISLNGGIFMVRTNCRQSPARKYVVWLLRNPARVRDYLARRGALAQLARDKNHALEHGAPVHGDGADAGPRHLPRTRARRAVAGVADGLRRAPWSRPLSIELQLSPCQRPRVDPGLRRTSPST